MPLRAIFKLFDRFSLNLSNSITWTDLNHLDLFKYPHSHLHLLIFFLKHTSTCIYIYTYTYLHSTKSSNTHLCTKTMRPLLTRPWARPPTATPPKTAPTKKTEPVPTRPFSSPTSSVATSHAPIMRMWFRSHPTIITKATHKRAMCPKKQETGPVRDGKSWFNQDLINPFVID